MVHCPGDAGSHSDSISCLSLDTSVVSGHVLQALVVKGTEAVLRDLLLEGVDVFLVIAFVSLVVVIAPSTQYAFLSL